jgi:hypothetical protein
VDSSSQHQAEPSHATTVMWSDNGSASTEPAAYTMPELDVMLVQNGSDVDIRADVWISWRPVRPAATYVSGQVTSVRVTYQPATSGDPDPGGVTVVTDAERIADLTALVNGLVVVPPGGVESCPAMLGEPLVATLSFTSETGVQTFQAASCPASVTTTVTTTAGTSTVVRLTPGEFVASVLDTVGKAG